MVERGEVEASEMEFEVNDKLPNPATRERDQCKCVKDQKCLKLRYCLFPCPLTPFSVLCSSLLDTASSPYLVPRPPPHSTPA